jgi:CDP-diacylglycerol--serine O-phosphatidyltransferase
MLHKLKVPDLITLLNALLGLSAIFVTYGNTSHIAPILILLAAIADGLDGYLALHMDNSQMGEYLDSLADVISFGVAPAIIIYSTYMREFPYLIAAVVSFYLVCGMVRLARFNTKKKSIPDFEGVPITASAVMIAAYLLMPERYVLIYGVVGLMLILSLLMVSNYPYPKIRGPKAMLPLSLIFGITIVSFFINVEYTHIFSTILFMLMILYLESPIMRIPRKYYED